MSRLLEIDAPPIPRPEKAAKRSSSSFVSLVEEVHASIVKRRRTFSSPMSCQIRYVAISDPTENASVLRWKSSGDDQ